MFSRTALARAFALPIEQQCARFSVARACLHSTAAAASTTTKTTSTSPKNAHPTSPLTATPHVQTSSSTTSTTTSTSTSTSTSTTTTTSSSPIDLKKPVAPTFTSPLQLTQSLLAQLPQLTSQRPHYIVSHLHDRPYLLTQGDSIRLPFLMPKVKPGDVLRFNRASVLGSRDFSLKGSPYVDERLYECRVRVVGVDAEPLRVKEKTKRRRRHVQHIKSKHKYTLLRVMDVKIKTAEELLQEGAVVV
ncbi:mitochondrial 54S ribosomal protein bL21m [Aspergillus saccharolyticus JOP 1030-1]|uniref:Large ribosomal subunit protein bL21m n=1 Tax=Aspergillus saccharolyticus JOP 1030-1 TaxID=1450539 RepID=A0A318Z067_9EURO|nr:putative aconitate hydratase [Aspergillus saccharolyticus JOP 1030-1]PYH40289.1 putative aconitate hydratase [Aspergillus saccharolyticus JOP 1030-1]